MKKKVLNFVAISALCALVSFAPIVAEAATNTLNDSHKVDSNGIVTWHVTMGSLATNAIDTLTFTAGTLKGDLPVVVADSNGDLMSQIQFAWSSAVTNLDTAQVAVDVRLTSDDGWHEILTLTQLLESAGMSEIGTNKAFREVRFRFKSVDDVDGVSSFTAAWRRKVGN